MAGDRLDIFGKSYYFTNTSGTGNNTALPILELLTGFLNTPGATAATSTHGIISPAQINTPGGVAGINSMVSQQNSQSNASPNKPRAFINIILFDEQFKAVDYRISMVGSNSTVKDHFTDLQNIVVSKSGFVYIYCSNESPVDVFFDNLQVIHTRSPILEETHYYPFGLTMSGISSKAAGGVENKKKFNGGSELQSKEFSDGSGLEMYDTHFRQLDPQLGRWWQLDPKPDYSQSLYSAMGNNPILFNDILGDTLDFPGASAEFQEQFTQATTLLEANGVGDLFNQASTGINSTIHIVEGSEGNINTYDPNTNTLYWSPTTALETDKGVKLSPAAILNHELDHAVQDATKPKQYSKDTDRKTGKDKQYDTKEEKRVITGSEQKTARALGLTKEGQVTRTNHNKGTLYPTTGVASTKNKMVENIKKQREQLKKAKEEELKKKTPLIKVTDSEINHEILFCFILSFFDWKCIFSKCY